MPCDVKLGKDMILKIGTVTVAKVNTMSVNVNGSNVDITSIGDQWQKHCQTVLEWNASIEGYLLPTDTGQNILMSKATSGGTMDDIKFFEDATNYWTPHTVVSAGGDADAKCSIESFSWSGDYSGIISFSAAFKGNGPIHRTT